MNALTERATSGAPTPSASSRASKPFSIAQMKAYVDKLESVPAQDRLVMLLAMQDHLKRAALIVARATKAADVALNVAAEDGRERARLALHAEQQAQVAATWEAEREAGRLLTSGQLCEQLRITPQALSKAVKANRVFYVQGPAGARLYPAFFGDEKYDLRNLEKISRALGALSGSVKYWFFHDPIAPLGKRAPLALMGRELETVLRYASALGTGA
jgi:hypothetical protein